MSNQKKTARLAGVTYLIIVITGFFSLMYVPSQIIDWADPIQTTENLINDGSLYRAGILAGLICFLAFVFLSLILYKLLNRVNKEAAILMVVLVLISIPISLIIIIDQINILSFLNREMFRTLLSENQIHAHVLNSLENVSNGILISQIFWGLWLLPFGYLVYHSGFIPKIFGILLFIGCFGYVSDSIGYTLFSGYADSTLSSIMGIPSGLGEIGICLWFLIVGVRSKPREDKALS